jgi:hypothetical protein
MTPDPKHLPDGEEPDADHRPPDEAPLPDDAPLPIEEPPEVTLDPSMGGIPASAAPPDSASAGARPPAEDITGEAITRDAESDDRRQPGADDAVARDEYG